MAVAFARDPLGYFSALAREPGAAVACRLGGRDGLLLKEPDDIRHVLVRNQRGYVKSRRLAGPRARYPQPHTLITSAGEAHRRKRITLQKAFGRSLSERLAERARHNAAALQLERETDLAPVLRSLAQRNILEVLFGEGAPVARLAGLSAARRASIERVLFSCGPFPDRIPTLANIAYSRATRRLATEIAGLPSAPGSVKEELESLLGPEDVVGELLTLSLTGYDSVAEALAWTLWLIAAHPAAAADSRGALRESLRLYPPTWIFARVAVAGDQLPSGASVRAGSKVYLCPWVVHRDPSLWPEPEAFDPSRFAAENGRPRYAYFPFGGGSHVCIAENPALAQVEAVLTTLTARYRLEAPAPAPRPVGGLTLSPRGARVRAEPL